MINLIMFNIMISTLNIIFVLLKSIVFKDNRELNIIAMVIASLPILNIIIFTYSLYSVIADLLEMCYNMVKK